MLELNKIYQGNSIDLAKQLDNDSIDCIVTSPPYWALRDYGNPEQLGLEENFNEYINKLCDVFDSLKPKLKNEGTLWVNIGDTYYTKSGTNFENDTLQNKNSEEVSQTTGLNKANQIRGLSLLPSKSLVGIPFRFAIEMMNRGWILRNTIIWHKPSCMPTSVKDRFTVDFEYLFFFVKNKTYYFEQQFEPLKQSSIDRMGRKWCGSKDYKKGISSDGAQTIHPEDKMDKNRWANDKGRNKRTTWTINTAKESESHFAVFPEELIETPIKAGCPQEGIVLDPFIGSGTTGLVAKKLGREFIGFELNNDYIKIAEKKIGFWLNQRKLI